MTEDWPEARTSFSNGEFKGKAGQFRAIQIPTDPLGGQPCPPMTLVFSSFFFANMGWPKIMGRPLFRRLFI